jgi:hypothetical protein
MKILFLGNNKPSATTSHRANALIRLGHDVRIEDPFEALSPHLSNRWLTTFHYRTGYRFLEFWVAKWIEKMDHNFDQFDCVWVESGELYSKNILLGLRQWKKPIILFSLDDPTGLRDGRRYDTFKAALNQYDLITAVRDESAIELTELGCKKVLRIWRMYDEVAHSSAGLTESDISPYISDVCFIGTWMRHEGRDKFLLELASHGLSISIWGDRWQKSPYWKQIQPYWRGKSLSGKSYVAAIYGAKICLGLLSKGNRDLHTQRSLEVPYAGGLFCAERTVEHMQLYKENEEAVFWADAKECAEKCLELLANPEKRERIRLAGMKRVRENKVGNEDVCRQILESVFAI